MFNPPWPGWKYIRADPSVSFTGLPPIVRWTCDISTGAVAFAHACCSAAVATPSPFASMCACVSWYVGISAMSTA